MQERFGAEHVDVITEACPSRLLAERARLWPIESILERLKLSIERHRSAGVAVVGHADCAGDPASREEQMLHVAKSVEFLRRRHAGIEIVGLWVDEARKVTEVPQDA